MQDWKITDQVAGAENTGLETNGLENDGLETDGVEIGRPENEIFLVHRTTSRPV